MIKCNFDLSHGITMFFRLSIVIIKIRNLFGHNNRVVRIMKIKIFVTILCCPNDKKCDQILPTVIQILRSSVVFFAHLQVKEFDSISRLDQWHTTLLLRIKKTIQGDEGDLK